MDKSSLWKLNCYKGRPSSPAEHSPQNKTFARVLLTHFDRQHFLHQDRCFYLLGIKGSSLYAQS